MKNSPVFPQVPFLGILATVMVWSATLLAALGLAGALWGAPSTSDMMTIVGAVMALGGTGKYLQKADNNYPFYVCGILGWFVVAFV